MTANGPFRKAAEVEGLSGDQPITGHSRAIGRGVCEFTSWLMPAVIVDARNICGHDKMGGDVL